MPSTLASLLARSLDFAGLFPPASLGVIEALSQFRREQAASATEMLARFVCPVLRLEELAAANSATGEHLQLSVLPRGGKSTGELLANLETDLATIQRLAQLHRAMLTVDTVELRPPADALQQPALRKLLGAVDALLTRQGEGVNQVFVELAPGPQLASQLELLAERRSRTASAKPPAFGYKLRTGGSDAAVAPSPSVVATTLGAVAALHLPMKCTGGLHRPLRTATGSPMHGFINLLVASAFASAARVDAGVIEAILGETDPAAFVFESRNLSWRDHKLTPRHLTAARAQFLLSFGSCYADQPRLELQKLGWWPRAARPKASAPLA